jgi:signal peptidase I
MKTTTVLSILAVFLMALAVGNAAPKSSASFDKALRDAEMVASLNPAWSVHRTSGESMDEFFGDNSLILVQEATSLSEIRVGMMLVYRSASGELIAHKVVAHHGTSVQTKGVANWKADPEPVTEDRIVGTVFAVFHTAGAPSGPVYTSSGSLLPTALCKTL